MTIVINEISKRKTPALVSIIDGERLIGEDANALIARFPDKIFARARDFLGRRFDDPDIKHMIKERFTDYTIVADGDRGTVAFKADDGLVYSAEEIVASLFYYAKEITTVANEGATVLDTVVSVPVHFSHFQRQAVIDAASLAGLNVLGLVNAHAGAALQFGIERSFENVTQRVVFYDLGANSLEAALVEYSSFIGKVRLANKSALCNDRLHNESFACVCVTCPACVPLSSIRACSKSRIHAIQNIYV